MASENVIVIAGVGGIFENATLIDGASSPPSTPCLSKLFCDCVYRSLGYISSPAGIRSLETLLKKQSGREITIFSSFNERVLLLKEKGEEGVLALPMPNVILNSEWKKAFRSYRGELSEKDRIETCAETAELELSHGAIDNEAITGKIFSGLLQEITYVGEEQRIRMWRIIKRGTVTIA